MANLTESPIYEPGIFQLEKTTPPLGGAPAFNGSNPSAGHANVQGQQLANRTAWLRQELTRVNAKTTQFEDYTQLRANTDSSLKIVTITKSGLQGEFYLDQLDTTSVDDKGLVIVDSLGGRWKRYYTGNVSTAWFGSRGDYLTSGIFDDQAFSDAAKAAPAINNISGAFGTTTFPRAPVCYIDVPAGSYGFQNTIDVANKEVTWVFSNAARIQGDTQKKLNGNIERPGQRITRQAYGTQDYATGFSVSVDASEYDKSPAVTGITSPSAFNTIPSHDSVGLFVGNYSKPALYKTDISCAFTATTVTLPVALTADQLLKIRRGMTVDTLHSPRWVGILDSWSGDGLTLTVTGWYLYGGSGASTPPNTAGVGVGGNDRAWGLNTALRIDAGGYSYQGIGHELSVYNTLGDSTTALDVDQGRIWGQLVATGGGDSFYCQAAYIAKGNWRYGFVANAGSQVGFYCETLVPVGFKYKGDGQALLQVGPDNLQTYSIEQFGNVIVGNDQTSGTRTISYKTSGLNNGVTYDVRTSATGGGASNGLGSYRIDAATFTLAGDFLPSVTSTRNIGSSSLLFNNIWSSVSRVNSQIIVGNDTTASSSRIIDFKTSGLSTTYDSRIIASGGTSTIGQGTLQISAADISIGGPIAPTTDNVRSNGLAARRWSVVYAATGTINTSDRNSKQNILPIDDKVLDAWAEVNYSQYKFKDAVEQKQDGARIHFGLIAQEVEEIFSRNGLNAFDYGLLCFDEWDGQPDIIDSWEAEYDEQGNLTREAGSQIISHSIEAGSRYGIRYEEALCLEAALLRRTSKKLEDRIKALEGK